MKEKTIKKTSHSLFQNFLVIERGFRLESKGSRIPDPILHFYYESIPYFSMYMKEQFTVPIP